MRKLLYILLILSLATMAAACTSPEASQENNKDKTELKVIIAGSLLAPFQQLEKEYESLHPDIDVLLEGHGSVQAIREVTELGDQADLLAVADTQLIPLLMYQSNVPDGSTPYAGWRIDFSTNKLGLAYKDQSAYAAEINAENWYQIISRPDVSVGLPDPRIDAMGYRVLMMLQLAEDYYDDDTIFEKTIGAAFEYPMDINKQGDISVITVPEIVKSKEERVKLRTYSIQLMALLESGDLDYAFEYQSVAEQRGLNFLSLPEGIDLSSPDYEENYRQVEVNLDFKRFASLMPQFKGARIVYGLTIPNNAGHRAEAAEFIGFLLGEGGKAIFAQNYQPELAAPVCDNPEALPESLKSLFPEEEQ